jgi:predicted RecB family nuclease
VSVRISKSKFCAGVQCLKRLYLLVHSPELAAQPSAADQAIIQQGHEVGMLARQLFPGGVEVCERNLDQAIRATRELVADPEIPAIFEAVFEHGGVLVKVDVLHRRRDGRWRLIEVKSTSDVKDHHYEDVAIQYRVVSRSGVDVASACLAHVNRGYVFDGQNIDARRFFRIRNLTRRVERLQPKLTFQLRSEFTVLAMSNSPDIAPGRHCTDPVRCEFYDRCNPPRPDDHIGYLPRIHASATEELEEMGIESIREIPDDFELSEIQRRAATCVQTGEPWFDREGLRAKLATLTHPLFFFDCETVNRGIPRFPGMRAYDQLPYQWSLHLQREPDEELEHHEFLATEASDPRREFISSLCAVLGESGSIVVYSGFESQRLAELAAWLPDFAERIKNIQSRLFDLLPLVRNYVYHPAFAGSYSLKAVLPALIPELTYEGMSVAEGRGAGLAWEALVHGASDEAERKRIEKALRAYCGQDTLALAKLLGRLRSASTEVSQLVTQRSLADPQSD